MDRQQESGDSGAANADRPALTLGALLRRFRWRVSLTLSLVVVETLIELLLPLLIGRAIDDLLGGEHTGLYHLALAGLALLAIGAARRAYDTRAYAGIYRAVAPELVARERERGASTSRVSARADLLTEFVEFMENSLPAILGASLSLLGVLAILWGLNAQVFLACLALMGLLLLTYAATGRFNYRFNARYNHVLERQVAVLEQAQPAGVRRHFRRLMHWNIRLSDLETGNYVVLLLGVIALIVYAPLALVEAGSAQLGAILAAMMYVFDYTEKLSVYPLYIQQLIRLREIGARLSPPLPAD